MKKEAPKKVYLHLTDGCSQLNGKFHDYKPAKIRTNDKIIEYTRTAAYRKKVERFMRKVNDYLYHCVSEECEYVDTDKFIADFRKYMKEE